MLPRNLYKRMATLTGDGWSYDGTPPPLPPTKNSLIPELSGSNAHGDQTIRTCWLFSCDPRHQTRLEMTRSECQYPVRDFQEWRCQGGEPWVSSVREQGLDFSHARRWPAVDVAEPVFKPELCWQQDATALLHHVKIWSKEVENIIILYSHTLVSGKIPFSTVFDRDWRSITG